MRFDVVSFGSAFVDVYLGSPGFKKVGPALCEVYGGKIDVSQLVITTGGGATNTAVGFERLGLQTAAVCCVGRDDWGLFIRKELRREGVSPLYIQQVEAPTSYSTILVAPDGGRTALVYRGASNELAGGKVEWDKLDPNWFYVSSLGGNFNLLSMIIRQAQKQKIKVALNPGSQEIRAREKLRQFLPHVEILLLNRQEAEALGKISGPKIIAVTEGRKGASLTAGKKTIKAAAVKVKTVEETGAGDAFGSAFVAGIINGLKPETALKMGLLNGAAVTTQFGPKAGLLFATEMNQWLKK
ncbi:hypothetical protein A3I57_02035 [Candidatus Beckwithbacteria bacterium RIFCSPLOWO2_02_FULL_47_23]|uniref:Carbohydrate kinase PfkB domain-containing protein n=1 Tax=Candidatus Beckwithbacteria bacterium RIFCSPLOWO2_02_FULL_47_23 TaxID=1797463 RepID=A0A1F5DSJ7_9BACT|nr:MAG: hypothetical protein A3I57_02035 [Candidatus Beckwithbacteria bacterium RIFCSPLOWO2_02_FULL_47_23]